MFRRAIYQLHLMVGILSGAVVFVISLAAAGYVFEQEWRNLFYGHLLRIEVPASAEAGAPSATVPLAELRALAEAASGHPITRMERTSDPARSWVMIAYREADKQAPGWSYLADVEYNTRVYIDPYRGRVLGLQDMRYEPIQLLRVLHQQLLLPHDVGTLITGTSALVLLGMVLTGLVLWWPRRWRSAGQRFRIKTDGSRRRLTWDLHAVGGFYVHLLLLVSITTGLAFAFDWWEAGIYRVLGDQTKPAFKTQPLETLPTVALSRQSAPGPMGDALGDHLLREGVARYPTARLLNMTWPEPPKDPAEGPGKPYVLTVTYPGPMGWTARDKYDADPATGQVTAAMVHEQKTLGLKWRNGNYDLHTGRIYGWPTKLLALFVSLFAASLPVTGMLIWWGRKRNNAMRRPSVTTPSATLSKA